MKDKPGEGIAFILPPSSFSLIFRGVAYGRAAVHGPEVRRPAANGRRRRRSSPPR